MAKQIPWLRVLLEGVVIITSILLAFGIDAWWERVTDNRTEADYLSRLEADLRVDVEKWETDGPTLSRKEEALDRALVWIQSPDQAPAAVSQLLEDLTLGSMLAYEGGFAAQSATFDELISTGGLGLMSPAVRTALLEYHRQVEQWRMILAARQTDYAATVYGLIPREVEFDVREGLGHDAKARIAEQILARDLESQIVAERNRGRLRQRSVGELLVQARAVVDLLVAERARQP